VGGIDGLRVVGSALARGAHALVYSAQSGRI